MAKISLFDKNQVQELLDKLRPTDEALVELSQKQETKPPQLTISEPRDEGAQCLQCGHSFSNRESQAEHFRSDWHRYNLKLRLNGAQPIAEEKFVDIMDEISSISGSDSEGESDSDSENEEKTKLEKAMEKIALSQQDKSPAIDSTERKDKRTSKICFKYANGQFACLYKCIFPYKEDMEEFYPDLKELKSNLMQVSKCCIILLNAGHFAAAIFEGDVAVAHKTFHRYVLRAKQGTVQSVKDQKGSAPKSGGASLRRYNEAALAVEIQTLLNSWKEEFLLKCTQIFLRAPHYSKSTFYNGKTAPLDRKDTRIKGIPFPTRRPTFNELKRVHMELYSVEIHEQTPIPKLCLDQKSKDDCTHIMMTAKDSVDAVSQTQMVIHEDIDSSPKPQSSKKRRRRMDKTGKNISEKVEEGRQEDQEGVTESQNEGTVDELYTVCKTGDLDGLKAVLAAIVKEFTESGSSEKPDDIITLHLNQPINKDHDTLLHIAAKSGHRAIVWHLLESGADPGIKNKPTFVPYSVSSDKPMKNTFRKFMAEYPEKYDYKSAQIPAPLTEEAERERKQKANERKKAQKALKKERMKEQRAEKEKEETEKQEKERFAALSDREKRAIAAERRFAQQLTERGNPLPNTAKRCWMCGESMLGKVPFEYFDFQFCTVGCLKKHKSLQNVNK